MLDKQYTVQSTRSYSTIAYSLSLSIIQRELFIKGNATIPLSQAAEGGLGLGGNHRGSGEGSPPAGSTVKVSQKLKNF